MDTSTVDLLSTCSQPVVSCGPLRQKLEIPHVEATHGCGWSGLYTHWLSISQALIQGPLERAENGPPTTTADISCTGDSAFFAFW